MSEEEEKKTRKRQCSPEPIPIPGAAEQQNAPFLPPWVAGGSPAKFVTKEEVMKISADLDKMELVHEIAIDPNYKIPEKKGSSVERAVHGIVHQTFYENLRKDLDQEPPEYENCFQFLVQLKKTIIDDILTAQHTRLKAEINQKLDESVLRASLDDENLKVKDLMNYFIDLCSRLCSPFRDSKIAELRSKTDIIDLFQGTMEFVELMKTDLANYHLSQNRSAIEEYSAKHEFEMFQKFLAENPNGCNFTRQWLQAAYEELFGKAQSEGSSSKKEKKTEGSEAVLVDTTSRGYVNLVHSEKYTPFPETFRIDKRKIEMLAEKFLQIVVCASAVFVTCNVAGKEVSESADFKKKLKNHLVIITNQTDEKRIEADLEHIGEQCAKEAKETAETLSVAWNEEKTTSIRNQVNALINRDNPIRKLVHTRVSTFVEEMLRSPTSIPHRLLPGLSVVQSELCAFTSRFLRLCVHNRKTFYSMYSSLVREFQGEAPSTHAVYHEDSPSSMPGPSTSS